MNRSRKRSQSAAGAQRLAPRAAPRTESALDSAGWDRTRSGR